MGVDVIGFRDYLLGRVSPNTCKIYTYCVSSWSYWLNGRSPSAVLAQQYIDYRRKEGDKPSTVNLYAHSIIKYFKYVGQGISLDCPSIPAPKPKYLPMDDIKKLFSSCRYPLEKTLIIPLFDTGVRISELLDLETNDIDWDNGFIGVRRKGGRKDQVNISEKALAVLKEWLDERQFHSKRVFGSLSYYEAWAITKKVGKRAGVKLNPHMLRHSRAAQMRLAGATLEDIRDHLGHKNINTTSSIYSNLKAVDLKKRIPGW